MLWQADYGPGAWSYFLDDRLYEREIGSSKGALIYVRAAGSRHRSVEPEVQSGRILLTRIPDVVGIISKI